MNKNIKNYSDREFENVPNKTNIIMYPDNLSKDLNNNQSSLNSWNQHNNLDIIKQMKILSDVKNFT